VIAIYKKLPGTNCGQCGLPTCMDCKLLFDSSAEDHIDIEYLAYLVERFAEELLIAG
jgi:ArsR family metal-binding transcriptional regulator